jgi:hypothetical protein
MTRRFKDGSSRTTKLADKTTSGRQLLAEIDNSYGEYYLINTNGDLECYDNDGWIVTYPKQ